jgi:tRNA pseudouridine55 synthase
LMQVLLGEETDTGDREGNVIRTTDSSSITREQIEQALLLQRGVIDQVPPHFSALKKQGVRLYKLARKGVFPELAPRKVEIFSLELLKWDPPFLDLEMICSKGTYARALARDLGQELDVGARLEKLRRTTSGPFRVEDALTVEQMLSGGSKTISEHMLSISAALAHIPEVLLQPAEIRKLTCGTGVALSRGRLPVAGASDNHISRLFKTVSGNEDLVILLRPEPKGPDVFLRPVKVFRTWEKG